MEKRPTPTNILVLEQVWKVALVAGPVPHYLEEVRKLLLGQGMEPLDRAMCLVGSSDCLR